MAEKKKAEKKKSGWFWPALNLLVLAYGVLLLHNPIVISANSPDDLGFNLRQLATTLGLWCVLLIALTMVPLVVLRGRGRAFYLALCTSLAVCVWVYSNILLPEMSLLDGSRLDLSMTGGEKVVDVLIFAALVAGSFFLGLRFLALVSLFALVLNLGLLAVTARAVLEDEREHTPLEDTTADVDEAYRFSEGPSNFLLILMDGFQGDVFHEVVTGDPELAATFDGFTYFKEAMGVGRTTYLSFPAIYSGRPLESGESIRSYVRESGDADSFITKLHQAGVDVTLFNPMMVGGRNCLPGATCVSSELVHGGPKQQLRVKALSLLDISLLRAVPGVLKPSVYNDESWVLRPLAEDETILSHAVRDNAFTRHVTGKIFKADSRPTFKFLYLINTHKPTDVAEDCSYQPRDFSKQAYLDLVGCALRPMSELIEQMKQLGIYDDTAILLIADHGVPCCLANRFAEQGGEQPWLYLTGAAHPLMAFKPLASRGALEVSEAPVQLTDVGATACAAFGGCQGEVLGTPIGSIGEAEARSRPFLSYVWKPGYWQLDALPQMTRYAVTGSLYDPASWLVVEEIDEPEPDDPGARGPADG